MPLKSGIGEHIGLGIHSGNTKSSALRTESKIAWGDNRRLHELILRMRWYKRFDNSCKSTFYFTGLLHVTFDSSNYTFHENLSKGRDWEKSRWLCQNSSEGDLVSIEEENEQIFVKSIIKNLKAVKCFIGLKKEQLSGKWKCWTNGKPVDASQGSQAWALGEPSGGSNEKCATIYGNYYSNLGKFDDLPCRDDGNDAGYICERVVSCTKDEKGRSLWVN